MRSSGQRLPPSPTRRSLRNERLFLGRNTSSDAPIGTLSTFPSSCCSESKVNQEENPRPRHDSVLRARQKSCETWSFSVSRRRPRLKVRWRETHLKEMSERICHRRCTRHEESWKVLRARKRVLLKVLCVACKKERKRRSDTLPRVVQDEQRVGQTRAHDGWDNRCTDALSLQRSPVHTSKPRVHHHVHRTPSQVAEPFRPVDRQQSSNQILGVRIYDRGKGGSRSQDLLVDAHRVVVKERLRSTKAQQCQLDSPVSLAV